ncbi:hypothetical protein Cgig2_002763 [Carnegiea gigantea]|uniref:Uncharacterized protein n=1 Tax=Carnegiea gigantea TaxID=171969 RepID=A0A9Q1GXE2_9CARY|nr:hypothetical protein Cgig2_002763 [Carnegiea gigantea]
MGIITNSGTTSSRSGQLQQLRRSGVGQSAHNQPPSKLQIRISNEQSQLQKGTNKHSKKPDKQNNRKEKQRSMFFHNKHWIPGVVEQKNKDKKKFLGKHGKGKTIGRIDLQTITRGAKPAYKRNWQAWAEKTMYAPSLLHQLMALRQPLSHHCPNLAFKIDNMVEDAISMHGLVGAYKKLQLAV